MNNYITESCNNILQEYNVLNNNQKDYILLSDFALLEKSNSYIKKKNANRYFLDYDIMLKKNKINFALQNYYNVSQNISCVICLETFNHNELIYNLECGGTEQPHIFHKICFEKWNKNSCPYCRTLL